MGAENSIPENHSIVEEFILDDEQVLVSIKSSFMSTIRYNPFTFKSSNSIVKVGYDGSFLIVDIGRWISKKLFDSLNTRNVNFFIIGYVDKILAELNIKLSEQKYLNGNILGNILSSLDILYIKIINLETQVEVEVDFFISLPPFPPSSALAKDYNHIFVRDFIDAITCYFNYNIDELVRKVITSLENFFHETHNKTGSFKDKLKICIVPGNYPSNWSKYLSIFIDNILIMYSLRNNIVHNKLRLNSSHTIICKKGMYTLFYIYQCALNEQQTRDFIRSLNMQFNLIEYVVKGIDLDESIKMHKEKPEPPIENMDDLDRVMFTGMKIDKRELNLIVSSQ